MPAFLKKCKEPGGLDSATHGRPVEWASPGNSRSGQTCWSRACIYIRPQVNHEADSHTTQPTSSVLEKRLISFSACPWLSSRQTAFCKIQEQQFIVCGFQSWSDCCVGSWITSRWVVKWFFKQCTQRHYRGPCGSEGLCRLSVEEQSRKERDYIQIQCRKIEKEMGTGGIFH